MNYFFNFMELTNAVPRFYGSLFGPESYSYVGLSFFNFGEKENSGLSASDIIASLALLVSAIALLYSWFQNNQNTKRAIKETFWMREVIIPKFLTPFFEFIQESLNDTNRLSQEPIKSGTWSFLQHLRAY